MSQVDQIRVAGNSVVVEYTPTIPHCSMATLIGLCIRVKLLRSLPRRYKVRVAISEGSHSQEEAVNKQLNDKERVAAAMENKHLLDVVNKCLQGSDRLTGPPLSASLIARLLGPLAEGTAPPSSSPKSSSGSGEVPHPLTAAASPGLQAIAAAARAPAPHSLMEPQRPTPAAGEDVSAWFEKQAGLPPLVIDVLA